MNNKEKHLKRIIKSLHKKVNRTEKRFNDLAEMWGKVPHEISSKIKREISENNKI